MCQRTIALCFITMSTILSNSATPANTDTHQQSPFAPAVCMHRGRLHMVFVANNNSRDLLHAESADGINWNRLANLGEQSKSQPSIISQDGSLVVAYIANNNSNDLIYSVWDENANAWTHNKTTGESSSSGPTLVAAGQRLFLYFIANNPSHDLLITEIPAGGR